ncbi:Beta-lactamase class C [Nitrospirillum viridazoti Y2]|uniref:CubicO group peptidase (Beta-lactamase class C family) n=1 Tax=Nitrospirillum amazonense TaxID=28077 RepID=A0A560J543_9PROT|nr:serine hydrolase domain-containing protein [Nitrospirillum amazonense]EGY02403.1 Beta-lactamase class C [Nitrospirillum amazonense Y2]TWB64354.1 CubicO group peptidase (beta-lactamase class C family) [Nitrospirillum amazonense]
MNRIEYLLAAAILLGMPARATAEPVNDYIAAEMTREGIPGLAVAIVRDGRLLRAQGYGSANLEHQVPVHADTLFKTGAIGMQLTAAAVMLLVQDGKIRLDDSIRLHLPEVPSSWRPITIRQLLNHTSGLPATPNGDFRADYTDAQLLDIIANQKLNFPAGARWRFSYSDYIVLGFLVKRVSGQYYADLLRQRVFTPLGMRTARAIDETAVIPNRAAGYEARDGTLRNAEWISPTANSTADGSLYLSVLDYAAWAVGMADRLVLTDDSWAQVAKPARLNDGCVYPYGFGWFQQTDTQNSVWWHSGTWQGFQTYAVRYLEGRLTVAVFANSDNADAGTIARHVAEIVEPGLARAPATPANDGEPPMTERVKRLLGDIAAGRMAYGDFTDYAKLDFTELMAGYTKTISALGQLRELAPFGRQDMCGDTLYRYRARFEGGVIEASVTIAANGRIGNLVIVPLRAWDAPL